MIVNVYSKLKSELIVVDILDKNNRPVDGVESDKKNGNHNFAGRFHHFPSVLLARSNMSCDDNELEDAREDKDHTHQHPDVKERNVGDPGNILSHLDNKGSHQKPIFLSFYK